ncbi:hypothetical protein SUDANB176_00898 [Streptomyces sp. enrichment culture]
MPVKAQVSWASMPSTASAGVKACVPNTNGSTRPAAASSRHHRTAVPTEPSSTRRWLPAVTTTTERCVWSSRPVSAMVSQAEHTSMAPAAEP